MAVSGGGGVYKSPSCGGEGKNVGVREKIK